MADGFEVRRYDAAGRLGELALPRSDVTVTTPALLPVVNPHLETISPARMAEEFGVEALITNGYVLYGSDEYRDRALNEGLHDLYDFPGGIMTDSGSYQLAEYGDIDVTTEEILRFQRDVGADVGTPVDIPTDPEADRDRAERELEETQRRLDTARQIQTDPMLVNAPIQGGLHPDLREVAARQAARTDLAVFPIGGVVPLLREYRFADIVSIVAAVKRGLGARGPVHLFGAGHPMMFGLAVALGCDLFDSAAYALYARDDRYLTTDGTVQLADLTTFPCPCPACLDTDPATLRERRPDERERVLAAHNLHVSLAEIRSIRQALRRGRLLELLETRARAHPAMLDGYRALLEHVELLERSDPTSKDTFAYLSHESARRPEVRRHHDRLTRLPIEGRVLLTEGSDREGFDACWRVVPPFGPVPRALSKTYPLNAELPERTDRDAYRAAARGITRLVEANPDVSFILAHDDWPDAALTRLPGSVVVEPLRPEE